MLTHFIAQRVEERERERKKGKAMCTTGMAAFFRKIYPYVGLASALACVYSVLNSQALNAELFSTIPKPINGTLETVVCKQMNNFGQKMQVQPTSGVSSPPPIIISSSSPTTVVSNNLVVPICAVVVDQPRRMSVMVYHISMGIPFLLTCCIGAMFCIMTSKEDVSLLNMDTYFIPDSFAPSENGDRHGGRGGGGGGGGLYTWEVVFWVYTFCVHCTLVTAVSSPVDIFDTAIIVSFSILCIMYLCRPRMSNGNGGDNSFSVSGSDVGSGGGGGGMQAMVIMVLALSTWLAFTSVPHVYESDRMWLLASLVVMDSFLLVVHLYDTLPTMYTISMGRLTYTTLVNFLIAYSYYSLKDRLQEYAHVNFGSIMSSSDNVDVWGGV